MGNRLYREELLAIRECIQNAVDAIRVFIKKNPGQIPYIFVDYKDNNNNQNPMIDIYDTGTGMNKEIINNHFLSIGENAYWYTNKCTQEWNVKFSRDELIADHGIGVLSYFMVASKIEVFTTYHWTNEFNHVYIDNYEDGVIFKKNKKSQFPKFSSELNISNPWDLGHGTCIRMHLNKRYSFYDFLLFLSKNLLRIGFPLFLSYNGYEKELPEIWHFREGYDYHCYSKNILSINDIIKCDCFKYLLILKNKTVEKGYTTDIDGNLSDKEAKSIVKEIIKKYDDNLIYLPNDVNTYIFPLLDNFDFELYEENEFYLVLLIKRGNKDALNLKLKHFKEFFLTTRNRLGPIKYK